MGAKEAQLLVLWVATAGIALGILSQEDCNQRIAVDKGAPLNGSFASPHFPSMYPDRLHCKYTFVGRPNQRVRINFSVFALQGRYPSCTNDYLDVYAQQLTEVDPLVDATLTGRFCGESLNHLPRLVVSSAHILMLVFYSNEQKSNRGFQGTYEFFSDEVYKFGTEAPPRTCGYTIRSENRASGYFVSPTYPGTYPDNLSCFYKLEGKLGQRIRIRFEEFILFHGGEYCPFDYVKIYDGYDNQSPVIGTFCGRYNASTVLYSTNEALYLEFVTGLGRIEYNKPPLEQEADYSFDRKGFNITYVFSEDFVNLEFLTEEATHVLGTECDQVIESTNLSNGTIFSPGYPKNFPEGVVCHYYFHGLVDSQTLEKVRVSFTDFNIPGNMPYCAIGYIGQQNNSMLGNEEVSERFCGNIRPPPLVSNGPKLVLVLNTHGAVKGGKFVASYKFITDYGIPGQAIDEGQCTFLYDSKIMPSGVFNSPRYPAAYPLNTECTYILKTHPERDELVVFHFEALTFPASQSGADIDCSKADSISVFEDIGRRTNFTLTERYCTRGLVPGPYATDNIVKVLFKSNAQETGAGFKASFKFVPVSELRERCDRHDIDSRGTGGKITSPQYPRRYRALTVCQWNIRASHFKNKILVEIQDLNMEGHTGSCQHAVLKIYNDKTAFKPLATVCGKSSELYAYSSAYDSLTLRFISSTASIGGQGFDLSWTEILTNEPCSQFKCAVNKEFCISNTLKCDGNPNCGADDNSDETAECPKSGGVKILHIAIGTSISSFFCIILLICGFYHRGKFRNSERGAPPDHDHVEVRYVSAPSGCNTTDRLLMEDRSDGQTGATNNSSGTLQRALSTDSPRCQKVSMV